MNILHLLAQYKPPIPIVPLTTDTFKNVFNVVFGIAGAVVLIVITLSGFRYTISRGDPQATNKAKNGILYASIGLIVVLLSLAIVNFVLGKL
jgi:uncharacterized membrane protein YidH (DUF202 family)